MDFDFKAFLQDAVSTQSPDVHLQVGQKPFIRHKTGRLVMIDEYPVVTTEVIQQIIQEITPKIELEIYNEQLQTDFSFAVENLGRFRVNLYQERFGPAIAVRIINHVIPSLEEIGLGPSIQSLLTAPYGLVLVTGPTGSGKSTTLAAMIDYINANREAKIITIEDPIEYVYENKQCLISQRELYTHTRNYGEAIRGVLRQGLDVILIGEMRDRETTEAVLTLAETGHLVFSTLHTNNAVQTIDRIIDMFPADHHAQIRGQISNNLKSVISQILVPTVDGKSRVAAREIMIMNDAIRSCILTGKNQQIRSQLQVASAEGMILMDKTLENYVRQGVISKEDALAKANDVGSLLQKIDDLI